MDWFSARMLTIPIVMLLGVCSDAVGQAPAFFLPEQRSIVIRDPTRLPRSVDPQLTRLPPTVRNPMAREPRPMSLDDAVRWALENADVVRVLSGVGAASSGLTIYSPAVRNTTVDQARAAFDPTINLRNNFFRSENPVAFSDPADPLGWRSLIGGSRANTYDFEFDVSKRLLNGASASLSSTTNRSQVTPGRPPLNPQTNSAVSLGLTQPLLQGRGFEVNRVPILLARIDTEQSYFRLKDALQRLLGGIVQGYWDLVQARINLWVLEQQLLQSQFVFELTQNEKEVGRANAGDLAQAQTALESFRASLVVARGALLDREASLRAILGLPPGDQWELVPVTPPVSQPIAFDWDALVELADSHRPDIIELKLILEADQQLLLQARNNAQPQFDAVALYRWNGLEGEMPVGGPLASRGGQFTDWTLGVNFSVPLALRASRATLRNRELLIANDRVNLEQGFLQLVHSLAFDVRSLDQLFAQYEAFSKARAAAETNLDYQFATYTAGTLNFLTVVQAINAWGSSVTSETRSLIQYNAALAELEIDTGTILESHGIRLFEERYGSLGPLGRWQQGRLYPQAIRPSPNVDRYPRQETPAEEFFDLRTPVNNLDQTSQGITP